jgi:hypothetical protein
VQDRTPVGELAMLQRLLGLALAAHGPPRWAELPPALRRAARDAYFLLDADAAGDAETFATFSLGRLLRQLHRTTERQQITFRGQAPGAVAWPATLKARYAEDHDPLRYVCRVVRHDFDTPENQLVKYLVERLIECMRVVPGAIRAGVSYFPLGGGRETLPTAARLSRIEPALNSFRRDARVRSIALPDRIDALHLTRADGADLEEYHIAASLVRRYQALMLPSGWPQQIAAIGRRVLLLPGRPGAEADAWINLAAGLLRG